jgi:peroxiredoxin
VAEAYSTTYPADSDWSSVARRLTFLIGPDGVVRKVYKVKDVASHAEEVLSDIASASAH